MMDLFRSGLYAFLACLGFCIMYNIHERKVRFAACAGGALMWVIYLLIEPYGALYGVFFSSLAVALYSETMARVLKKPATVFLIVGILPLVPGGGIYHTMYYCIQGNMQMFVEKLFSTVATAGLIAVAVSLSTSAFRISDKIKRK